MIKSGLLLFILIFSLTSKNIAQFSKFKKNPFSNTVLLSLGAGFSHSETDYPKSDLGISGAGFAEYFLKTDSDIFFGLKLEVGYINLKSNENNYFNTDVISAGPSVTLNYQLSNKLYPYLGIGVKNLWYEDYTALNLTSEIGIRFLVSRYFTVNGSISLNFLNEDNIDGLITNGSQNDFYSSFMLSMSYAVDLTITDDLDGDGIKNAQDTCPEQEEDFDGFQDDDGCPEFDNDDDGIIDSKDDCTNEAEDFDGYQDQDGCPDPDNDEDGINDSEDNCPDLREDFDGFQDLDGCPELDNDGDGIVDENDKCPNEKENFNSFEDSDGCPDEIPETEIIEEPIKLNDQETTKSKPVNKVRISIPNEFLLEGDNTFKPNSAILKQSAYSLLNDIVIKMKSNPEFKWRIEGHLDNSGSPRELKALSTSRANTIKNYLVSRGLKNKSFQAVGLSDQFPLAPNSTIIGKLKNRRVVIKRIR